MTSSKRLKERKALLLKQIEQQRLDLSHSTKQWIAYTAPLDHYWQTFIKIRKVAVIGAGIFILFSLKKPSRALRLSKTAIKAWGTTRLLQKLFITDQKI